MRLENRKENRVVLSVPVRYKVFHPDQLEKEVQDPELKSGAELKNVSRGGLQVVSSQAFQPGCVLELELEIPGNGRVRSVAKVIWCVPDEKTNSEYQSGIQFIPVYEEDLRKLEDFLKRGE
jgi:Tfp pilus assembly protein PilZ